MGTTDSTTFAPIFATSSKDLATTLAALAVALDATLAILLPKSDKTPNKDLNALPIPFAVLLNTPLAFDKSS